MRTTIIAQSRVVPESRLVSQVPERNCSLVCVSSSTVAEPFAASLTLAPCADKRERRYVSDPVGTAKMIVVTYQIPRVPASCRYFCRSHSMKRDQIGKAPQKSRKEIRRRFVDEATVGVELLVRASDQELGAAGARTCW